VIRVLICDDHTLFREGLRSLLRSTPEIEVIGEAATGTEAVERASELLPDVVLMDIQMPTMNGIEAARKIGSDAPSVGVLMLTMFEDDDSVFAAMRAGARGYIMKGSDQAEMLRAIQAVANGEALFGPSIAQRLLAYMTTAAQKTRSEIFPQLTGRESELLELIATGLNNVQIAERLVISPKTVRNHISNIFSKLQVADRAQAIIRAREAGLRRDELV